MEDGVEAAHLGEPGADGLNELTSSLQSSSPEKFEQLRSVTSSLCTSENEDSPVLLPLQQLARLEVICPEFEEPVLFAT